MGTQRDFHNEFSSSNSLVPAARNASANGTGITGAVDVAVVLRGNPVTAPA